MTVVKVNIDMSELEFRVICRELLDRINKSDFSENSDLYKQLVKKVSDNPVSFEEACEVVLENMESESCKTYDVIVNNILKEYNYLEPSKEDSDPKYLDDVFKEEVLEKIKNEFTLEQIEKMYESKH